MYLRSPLKGNINLNRGFFYSYSYETVLNKIFNISKLYDWFDCASCCIRIFRFRKSLVKDKKIRFSKDSL